MTVYVDQPRYPSRWHRGRHAIVFHMFADSEAELHAMAEKIGVGRQRHKKAGTTHSHYEIYRVERGAALGHGAKPIDPRPLGRWLLARRRAQKAPQ